MEESFFKYIDNIGKIQKAGIKSILPILINDGTPNTYAIANNLEKKYINKEYARQYVARRFADKKMNSSLLKKLCNFYWEDSMEINLLMDQTELGDKFAILSVGFAHENRCLPIDWEIECGKANLGFDRQELILNRIADILPTDKKITLYCDRFYCSTKLIEYCKSKNWDYRLRLKSNISIDTGIWAGKISQIPEKNDFFIKDAILFENGVKTNIGYVKDDSYDDAWIIAMSCQANRENVLDYSKRWGTECMFKDFKSSGFHLEQTKLSSKQRINGLLTFISLALYWSMHMSMLLKKSHNY